MPTPTPADGEDRAPRSERRLERPREGRWLAGVCAALARYSGRRVGTIRLAFVLTIPFFGLPLVAYLAGWLILPEEGGRERSRGSVLFSGLVTLLLGFGGGLALLTLAAASLVASVFGFGWGVVIVAAGVLVAGLFWMREVNPGWMLLPLAALVVPAAVVSGLNANLDREVGRINAAPRSASEIAGGYRIGLGTLFIDLRHYDWASGDPRPLKITGGLGRTIVALPQHRCVAVRVDYDTHAGLLNGVADVLGFAGEDAAEPVVFGRTFARGHSEVPLTAHGDVPVLSVDYSSEGGELFVRSYPNSIDPTDWSDWPGDYFNFLPGGRTTKAKVEKARRVAQRVTRGPCAKVDRR